MQNVPTSISLWHLQVRPGELLCATLDNLCQSRGNFKIVVVVVVLEEKKPPIFSELSCLRLGYPLLGQAEGVGGVAVFAGSHGFKQGKVWLSSEGLTAK